MTRPTSMKDKLPPEYGKRYHIFDPHSMRWTYAYWTSDAHQGGHFETEIGLYVYASHWMLEPEYPEEYEVRSEHNLISLIEETKIKAKQKGQVCYLYDRQGVFYTTFSRISSSAWIYKAHPSGRHSFSPYGINVARTLGVIK